MSGIADLPLSTTPCLLRDAPLGQAPRNECDHFRGAVTVLWCIPRYQPRLARDAPGAETLRRPAREPEFLRQLRGRRTAPSLLTEARLRAMTPYLHLHI